MAYVFAFVNGAHNASNAIATTIATRALTPRPAIIMAAVFNFIGAYATTAILSHGAVASTISRGLVHGDVPQRVIIAALLAAILWGLFTWYLGLPSSSAHALVGGLLGAFALDGMSAGGIIWRGVWNSVIIPMVTSPIAGILAAFVFIRVLRNLLRPLAYKSATGKFKKAQIFSAALTAFAQGGNNTQKTMGIVTLALAAAAASAPGALPAWALPGAHNEIPMWVILSSSLVMALGTSIGGMRIIKTLGSGILKLTPVEGFAAETSSAIVIEAASLLGAPIATTHVVSCAIMGVGAAKSVYSVRWKVVRDMVLAWVITIPATALAGAAADFLLKAIFGHL